MEEENEENKSEKSLPPPPPPPDDDDFCPEGGKGDRATGEMVDVGVREL